eukprot:13756529-Alexandrium_andersonii.AAC.1
MSIAILAEQEHHSGGHAAPREGQGGQGQGQGEERADGRASRAGHHDGERPGPVRALAASVAARRLAHGRPRQPLLAARPARAAVVQRAGGALARAP